MPDTWTGRKHSEASKAKMRAAMIGRPKSEVARANMSIAAKGKPRSIKSRLARAQGQARYFRDHMTPSEEQLALIFAEEGVSFTAQVAVWTFIVDFVVWPNIVVEVDGRIHKRAIRREWDTERDMVLNALGFTVIRILAKDLT